VSKSKVIDKITYLISLCFFVFRSVGCSINLYLLTRGDLTSLASCKLLPPPIRFSWHQFGSWHRCDEIGCGRFVGLGFSGNTDKWGNLKTLRLRQRFFVLYGTYLCDTYIKTNPYRAPKRPLSDKELRCSSTQAY
jgi:hypothetical protein